MCVTPGEVRPGRVAPGKTGCYLHLREVAEWAVLSGRCDPILGLVPPPLGPPDAPLDVQVEPGPSPGILIISWLPVTIDAAGTSNGVRVTGYAIYADGQKVQPGAALSRTLGVGRGSLPSPVSWEQGVGLSPLCAEMPVSPAWHGAARPGHLGPR